MSKELEKTLEALGKSRYRPLELTPENFGQTINSEKPVIVNFWAVTCPTCVIIPSSFDRLAAEYGDKMVFAKFNVFENYEYKKIADRYDILSLPTYAVFKNGELLERLVSPSVKKLERFVMKYVKV
ncbi:MAG: thioredoxin family protein [Nitrososphaerales archaeon]